MTKKMKIILPKQKTPSFTKIPWLQWKNYSCRIDVFATVVYHIFFYECGDSFFPTLIGPSLPNEIHPLGILMHDMNDSSTLFALQKSVDKYPIDRRIP